MTSPGSRAPSARLRCVALIGATVVGLLGACSSDRPASSEWNERWAQKQSLVPTELELAEGGRSFCDQLLSDLRTQLGDLEPTASESIDPAFDSWSAHLRTLAFECPTERTRIRAALATIDTLSAEIQVALDDQ